MSETEQESEELGVLRDVAERLERIAQQLRDGDLPEDEAITLIEQGARLAADATAALDRSLAERP